MCHFLQVHKYAVIDFGIVIQIYRFSNLFLMCFLSPLEVCAALAKVLGEELQLQIRKTVKMIMQRRI